MTVYESWSNKAPLRTAAPLGRRKIRSRWLLLAAMFALQVHAQPGWVDKSPHKSGFVTVNGVRLHYLDWGGKGGTLLFLHGAGGTPHLYDLLAPKFTNQFRVLGLTRRGHGESEIPDSGYDAATRVEDIRQFLDALKIRRAIVAGHSAGGNELSHFAITHPERVTKLVYLDASYYMPGHIEILKRMPPELLPTAADQESLDGLLRYYKRTSKGWSEASEADLRVYWSSDGKTWLNAEKRSKAMGMYLKAVLSEVRPDHTRIKSPALMIIAISPGLNMGGNVVEQLKDLPAERRKAIDDILSEARQLKQKEIELFRKEIPNGRVVMLTNADHNCFIDRENEVVREMRAFLGK